MGAAVEELLAVPISVQNSLTNELAVARASIGPLIRLYDAASARHDSAADEAEQKAALLEQTVLADKLREALIGASLINNLYLMN